MITEKTSDEIQKKTVLDEYTNRVFRLVVLIVPIFFMCGNGTMTILNYMGWYPGINRIALWCANCVDIIYMVVAIYLIKTSYGADGNLIYKRLATAKKAVMIMVILQWNMNSYVCPFSDFWAFAPLFVIVEVFFFDVELVTFTTAAIVVSMVLSWIINGKNLLPVRDEFFYLNLIFRGIGLTFTLLSINFITWFGKVFIIETIKSREKEREMYEKSLEFEHEARIKSDFLANMSHEIRTPMNAVIGMAELAMRQDMPAVAKEYLTQIQRAGRSLLNIINDILDYSKIEAGKMEIVPGRYEPTSELNDVANMLATRIGEKDLDFYVAIDANLPHALLGDVMRIRQALLNFANNAIKFTPSGSVGINVTCKNTDEDMVELTFHIKDTGIGIKEEDMEKLFVSFQQVDSRRNRAVEGAGLGLAIAKRLVEAMGGSVGVQSVYGVGSDFWFTIPQKVIDPTIDLKVTNMARKRAIIMDDDSGRIGIFLEEMEKIGIEALFIPNLDEYKPVQGRRDYLFFRFKEYNDKIKEFLNNNPDVTGAVVIDYQSVFRPDLDNLFTLRRPVFPQRIVRILNDEKDSRITDTEEAFTIEFTAPTANILIVDDNDINISIAEGLLAPMEMNVDSALSGPEAIKKIQGKDYDIVLMDHMMPDMDGVDATKIIRETKGEDDLVIIALSANALEEARKMFLEVGMNDFVAKPIEIKELVSKIRKWLPPEKVKKSVIKNPAAEGVTDDPLMNFEMLDVSHAVRSLGSPHLFRKIAGEYVRSGPEKYDGIKSAFLSEDIKDFTIRTHALKSSSRQIGAVELGDMAEALEMAGNNNDMEFIRANIGNTLTVFKNLLDAMKPLFEEDEKAKSDLPELPKDVKDSLLGQLKMAVDDLDMDVMETIGAEFKKYSWPSDIKDDLDALCKAIDDLDSDVCEEMINKLMF